MNSRTIVSKYKTEWSEPPELTPADKAVDGPLLGNGDMGVAISGTAKEHQFILCKSDLSSVPPCPPAKRVVRI
jgi:alpha-L-fucosidase 2